MSFLSSIGNFVSGIFGGGGGGSGDIFKAILGGIGGSADAKLSLEMAKETTKLKGLEDRKSLDFTAKLEDYAKQQDKFRKRVALDTYGQFSLLKRYAPNMVPAPPVQVPTQPTPQP